MNMHTPQAPDPAPVQAPAQAPLPATPQQSTQTPKPVITDYASL